MVKMVHIQRRNKALVKRYNELVSAKTKKGKDKYTFAYIIEKLEEEFYLTDETIAKIIRQYK